MKKDVMDIDVHTRLFRNLKEHMDWSDLMPQLACLVDGQMIVAGLAGMGDSLAEGVALVVAQMRPTQIIAQMDGYISLAEEVPRDYQHGEFAERFAEGDDSVQEALIVVKYDGVMADFRICPYIVAEHKWLDEVKNGTMAGRMSDAIQAGWWAGWEAAHGR